ncbi:MAG: hypothetical protein AAFY82_07710, partial [Pseudomonadota bacterium]
LLDLEAAARAERRGLWATSRFTVFDASELTEPPAGFYFVNARLGPIVPLAEEVRFPPACRRVLEDAALVLDVRRDARTACGLPDGVSVLVRGYVSDGLLDLTYPRHLQERPDIE